MEDFRRHTIATAIKTDKKDMLLSTKDPHLSRLFEQGGPNTPNNVSAENLAQSSIDVDGNYVEETTEHDYTLFPGQSGSFIQGFSAESSHLVMDVSCADTCTSGNAAPRCEQNDENNNATLGGSRKLYASDQVQRLTSLKEKQEHQPPNILVAKHTGTGDGEKSQLLSPPPDHYNMQLLAHSAQLQQQQQRMQQELYNQGSSSAALQQLARLHQQKEQGVELTEEQASYPSKPVSFPVYPRNDNVKTENSPKPVQMPVNAHTLRHSFSPSTQTSKHQNPAMLNFPSWTFTGRSTPDFERGHIRDLSFSSQDSPILGFQPSDVIKGNSKHYHKSLVVQPVSSLSTAPEPELKSPLDHPDQLEQHRNRFFSSDSCPASSGEQGAGEAVLNENDKKAVAAIGKLMEIGEKVNTSGQLHMAGIKVQPNSVPQHSLVNSGAPLPLNVMQMQDLMRNTPPPPYEHTNLLPGSMAFSTAHPVAPHSMASSDVKREPESPSKHSKTFFLADGVQYKLGQACNVVGLPEEQSKFFPAANANLQQRDTGALLANAVVPPPDVYPTAQQINNQTIQADKGSTVVPAKPASRSRRTSSSSSTRRKSDSGGNLTCGICGHSFKSTPALNGHMRVHSAPEKKQNKEERQGRTASHDSSGVKASPLTKTTISPQLQPYYDGHKLQSSLAMPQDPTLTADGSVRMLPYPIPQDDPSANNRSHNGLLTMASAACFLKTKANKTEYLHPTSVLPPAYIMPNTILFPQPAAVVPTSYHVDAINPAYHDNQGSSTPLDQNQLNESHSANYSQIYATPFQQGLTFSNIGFFTPQVAQPLGQQETSSYPAGQQGQVQLLPDMERDNMTVPPQDYVTQQDKVLPLGASHDNYSTPYETVQNTETNSLCQLASIAVAAANREYVPEGEVQPNMTGNYSQTNIQPANIDPGNSSNVAMIPVSMNETTQQDCLNQETVFRSPNMTAETSPLQSGNDPFFYPVTNPNQQQTRYEDYSSMGGNATGNRSSMVTWKDSVDARSYPLMSSYDDPLMQEAVNVANPSKILPNSMMGGTPPTGSLLSGARPFRQRHHSEGAHLIKNSESRIFNQIMNNTVPDERPASTDKHIEVKSLDAFGAQPVATHQLSNVYSEKRVEGQPKDLSAGDKSNQKEEFWAEPKPIQRRRRRHSADSRLLLKPNPLTGTRQTHLVGNLNKKPGVFRGRARRRPPPLVIPSSVNTFTSVPSIHSNLYQSHLHHRRRPSGESSSSSVNNFNDKIPPYTPPPMLSPIRAGSGLYCTTPVTPMFNRQKSIEGGISTIMEVDESIEDDEELVRSSEPKINIGHRFQAAIPAMYPKGTISRSRHKADKVWNCKGIESDKRASRHVEQLMELSCSAVVPYGGSNKEFALDCLAQSNGDILSTVRRLISRKVDKSLMRKNIKNYSGAGKPWSSEEMKLFDCAMLEHRKDFFIISQMVKTRTTAECVHYYYHVSKRNRRRHRLPRRYRDQENDEFATLLADSLHSSKNVTSSTSWSDDETTIRKSKISSDSDMGWVPINDSHNKPDSISYSSQSSPSSMTSAPHQAASSKPLKTRTARIQQLDSPVGSPVSTMSNDEQPTQIFSCPVCGKSFGKVKSRNAHMKTHGKQAQEKRRQREEEAARRREEIESRQLTGPSQSRAIPVHHSNFIHPTSVNTNKLFQHPQHHRLQARQDVSMPRFGNGM